MRKKAVTKKIAEKSEKKEIKKKPTTTLKPAKRTSIKKKELKKSKTKERKITAKKIKITAKEKPKKVMAKVKVKEKPKKVAKKVVARAEKKPKKIKAKVEKGISIRKIKKVEIKETIRKLRVKVEEKPKKPKRKVIDKVKAKPGVKEKVYPAAEEKYPAALLKMLPTEYGDNGITLMIVDPVKLFAFWEVREDTLSIYTGDLNVRVYDVTGVDLDSMNANSYFDVPVNNRIGSRYIDVGPEKEFVADIGIISPYDIFITIARSNKVSTPRARVSEEGLLPKSLYETGLRVGY